MKLRGGQTRKVLLVGRWAVKVPNPSSWKQFVMGILANLNERGWSGYDDRLCPVLWASRTGLLLVMRRAGALVGEVPDMPGLPFLDMKAENFGVLEDRVVSVDYAETIESMKCPECERFWDEVL